MRFRKIWQGSWWWLGEPCEAPRSLLWRGLRCHCPMYSVSCILSFFSKCVSLSYYMDGWILSGQNYMVLFLPSLGHPMGPALKGWKWVWGHLLSQPSDTLAQRWLPVHTTWWPVGLEEVSVPKGGMLAPRGTTVIPWNWKCRLPPSHFGFLMPLNQQAKKAATGLPEVIDADHQGQVRRPVHKRGMVE